MRYSPDLHMKLIKHVLNLKAHVCSLLFVRVWHTGTSADSRTRPGITGPGLPCFMLIFCQWYFITLNLHNYFFFHFTELPVSNVTFCRWHIISSSFAISCGPMPTFCLKRVWKDLAYKKMMLNINCDVIWAPATWITPDTLTDAE